VNRKNKWRNEETNGTILIKVIGSVVACAIMLLIVARINVSQHLLIGASLAGITLFTAWWFHILCLILMIGCTGRIIQKELQIFKRINRKNGS